MPVRTIVANITSHYSTYEHIPICDGVIPFLPSFLICSLTSSAFNFNHDGTERRYGKADWDIPLLQMKRKKFLDFTQYYLSIKYMKKRQHWCRNHVHCSIRRCNNFKISQFAHNFLPIFYPNCYLCIV